VQGRAQSLGLTLLLFMVLQPGQAWGQALVERIQQQIRSKTSGRHVPCAVVQVSDLPRSLSGKKMKVPVRKLLPGAEAAQVASPDAMQNPASLDFFIGYAKTLGTRDGA